MATGWFILVAVVSAAQSPAPSVQERIERGKSAIDNLEYEAAVDELVIAADSPDATLEQRVEANLYAGIAHRVQGKDVDAKLNFVFVLKNDPDARLPEGTAPKINNFFELIRQEVELTRAAPAPAPEAPTPAPAAPEQGSARFFIWGGTALLVVGFGGAAASVVAIGAGELVLGVRQVPGLVKEVATWTVLGSILGIGAMTAVGTVGGGVLFWGLLE